MPEPAIANTIWRPRDCIPQVETKRRHYGIMPNTQYSCMHHAEIHLTEDQAQSPVQRPPSIEDTEMQHITHISDNTKISNYKHCFILYISRYNPKTHRTGADSRRQPDPSGSTRHVRNLHHSTNESQDNPQQRLDNNWIPHLITPKIYHTLKPESLAERQLHTKNRLHPAVHRSTALCGMLGE